MLLIKTKHNTYMYSKQGDIEMSTLQNNLHCLIKIRRKRVCEQFYHEEQVFMLVVACSGRIAYTVLLKKTNH